MGEHVFALDIGTRSVTGIILQRENSTYSIIDYCMKEHRERSMHDGQIHNIPAVANVILDVKQTLEQTHGPLKKVYAAAAGRALKTVQAQTSVTLGDGPIKEHETISFLELDAVQEAQKNLAQNENIEPYQHYYCVGYSVLHYQLDDTKIGSLIDQHGENVKIEVIATFLPKVVIEALLAALDEANLDLVALTLEPIAAIDVLIPESMRRLNVALVDIGAGTSDIAITDNETITAYGMVPMAGDEITEAISDSYLLDFSSAEEAKRAIVNKGNTTVNDILGFEQAISYNTLVKAVDSTVENLANTIATEILTLNARQPKAIMLIGGGSLTPQITHQIAKKLHLPENRVAVRGIDVIQNLTNKAILPPGPNYVTTIGIGITAKENPVEYMNVQVNGNNIRLFEMKQLTVGDCLVQAGINNKKYYGKPGIAKFITINDQDVTLPGEHGKAPEIYVNGKKQSLTTHIQNGDQISLEKGSDGKNPHVTVEQIMDTSFEQTLYVNEHKYQIEPRFLVNGVQQDKRYIIQDNDTIIYETCKTIGDFFDNNRSEKIQTTEPFILYVNHRKVELEKGRTQLFLNGKKATHNQTLNQHDHLTIQSGKDPAVSDLLEKLDEKYWHHIQISFNGRSFTMKKQQLSIMHDGKELNENNVLTNHDSLQLKRWDIAPFIFQDTFRYADIDTSKINSAFQLYKNGNPTAFHETIDDGDILEID